MSDLIKSFAFDLQRFADNTFTGGKVEGEEGITLSSLFNSAGRVWATSDVESLGSRTYFWENEDAKVSLTPENDNAPGAAADGIALVKGTYDDPTKLSDGSRAYAIKTVEAIDAYDLNGGTATFATLNGVTKIVNANGTIDIDGDEFGAIKFNGGGSKAQDSDLNWEVGTVINLSDGKITTVDAAAGEQITTADETAVAFVNGGEATFAEDSFDTVTTFAKDGTAELDMTIGGADANIVIDNLTDTSEIIYNFNESGDILDLTASTAKTDTDIAVTAGEATFLVVNDTNADTSSAVNTTNVVVGGTSFAFNDLGDNGGAFVLESGNVTGFLFRDTGDAITVPKGISMDFWEPKSSTESAMATSSEENASLSLDNFRKAGLGFSVTSTDSDYTVTKTDDGYSVEVGDGAEITTDSGATVKFTLPKEEGANAEPTATVNFTTDEDGNTKLASITDGSTGGNDNSGISGSGATVEISGLTADEVTDDFSINDDEITIEEGTELDYTQTVKTDENGNKTTEVTTNANGTYTIGGESYEVAGLTGSQSVAYLKDSDGNVIGLSGVTGTASVTGSFNNIDLNGEGIVAINSAESGIDYTFSDGTLTGLKDGDAVESAGAITSFVTDDEDGDGTFTILGTPVTIKGDSSVEFGVGESALTSISDLDGSAIGALNGISINGGRSLGVTETYSSRLDAGDGEFEVTADGTSTLVKISALSGLVTVTDVAGASQLEADGTIVINHAGGRAHAMGDPEITFEIDGTSKITGVENFADGVAATVEGVLSGLTINDNLVDVVGDGGSRGAGGVSAVEKIVYKADGNGNDTLVGIDDGGAGVTINAVGGASIVQTYSTGKFDFFGKQQFAISGTSNQQLNYALSGTNVTAISNLAAGVSVATNFANGLEVNGQSVSITGDDTVTVTNVNGDVQLLGLNDGASLSVADGITVAKTEGSGTFNFANGQGVTVTNDPDGVEFTLDGEAHVIGIDGLNKGATYAAKVSEFAGTDLKEVGTTLGGDSVFSVAGDSDGINGISGLGGVVTFTDAGGASQLVTNDKIDITDAAGRNFTVTGDDSVTFGLDDDTITTVDDFDTAGAQIEGNINGLTVNGAEIDVTGDDGDMTYTRNGANDYKLSGLNGSELEVTEKGDASIVATTGDAKITFFDEQTFTVANEGDAYKEGSEVEFILDTKDNVTAVAGLYGNVTGDFDVEDGILVNGKKVEVEGDTEIVVYGSKNESSVSAIGKLSNKATLVSAGGAEKVSTDSAGVFTIDNTKYTVAGDASVTFDLDSTNGTVKGVSDFTSGTLAFDVEDTTVTLAINPSVNETVTIKANGKVTLTVDSEGSIIGVAGAQSYSMLTEIASLSATDTVTVNGTIIDAHDADKNFQVSVDEDNNILITGMTGNATIGDATTLANAEVITDADGNFNINDKSYTVKDDDGVVKMTIEDSVLTAVDSLVGSIVSDNVSNPTLDVNGQAVAISGNDDSLSVTIVSDGENITEINGLDDNVTVTGDLDKAAIAMPASYSVLKVNDTTYTLGNDSDGVTVTGAGKVTDLDEEANLYVSKAGTYIVNGQTIEAQAGNRIIGYDNGKYAELYDPDTVLIRKGTDVYLIENRLGMHDYNTLAADSVSNGERLGNWDYTDAIASVDNPLDREATEELFAEDSDVNLDKPIEIYIDNAGEKTVQTLDFSDKDFTKKVHMYRGPQDVAFNSEGGNLAIVGVALDTLASEGEKNITLGGGAASNAHGVGDVVVVDEAKAIGNIVNILGGAGADSIYVRNNADVTFDMSKGGADKLITFASSNARVTLEGYDPATNAGIQIEEPHARDSVGGIAQAIDDGIISFGDGIISLTTTGYNGSLNTAEITFEDNSVVGGTLVNLYTPDGTRQGVGFTHSEGGTVGSAERTDDLILIGNSKGDKKGTGSIVGGIGNDTVFAGEGDTINAGAGNNVVVLDTDTTRGGAYIVLGEGKTTIRNSNNGRPFYADHADTLEVDPAAVSYDDGNLVVEGDGFYATVVSPAKDSIAGTATDSIGLTTGSDYVNQLVKSGDTLYKMAVGDSDAVIDVKGDEDIRANYYKAGGVTFENYNGKVRIDLSDGDDAWGSVIEGVSVTLDGVTSIEAGEGDTTIKGSEANETFYAGKGNTSLYGAGGKNLLVGYEGNATVKEGSTTFFVLGDASTGVNTIQSFAFVNDNNYTNNSIAADMIEIDTATNFVAANSVEISNSDVVFSVENRNTGVRESVVVKDAASTTEDDHIRDMRMSDSVIAQVADNNLKFDKFANFYLATGKNASVSVSNDTDYSKVWLDNAETGSTFVGDIKVINALNASVTAELAGNDGNNTILAGSGETSLWGGNFGDDLLIGGTGTDRFFYAVGNGTDTIQGAKSGDIVDLANNTLDLISTEFDDSGSGLTLKFTDGGSLRVDNADGVAFKVGDDTYYVNDEHNDYNKRI